MPEPPRRAALGHLPDWMGIENATRVLERILGYAEHCGPVARVSLGPMNMVVISDAEAASIALADPRANYKGASYVLTRAVLDNVLLLNGAAWEKHRALYRKALRGVDVIGPGRALTRAFAERIASEHGDVMLDREVLRLVGDVVARFVAGVPGIPPEVEPHRHRVQYELAAIGIDLLCQPWTYLSPRRWTRMRRSVREARRFFRSAVDARLARPDPEARDILNGFIALAAAGEYPGDAESIQEGVVNFFFTAHDVLASSTSWTLHLLATHPEVQARLRADLRTSEGPAALERVMKEGLRLFPGYGLFGRTTRAPMEIAGYSVPRGTLLIVSPFVTHRLERYWPRAKEFDPERWRERSSGQPAPTARDHYLPFGSGARACLASHLAFPLASTLVREVIEHVELVADRAHDPGLVYWGTSYARHGMPVRVKRVPGDASRAHAA
jgi:cytochrome P450